MLWRMVRDDHRSVPGSGSGGSSVLSTTVLTQNSTLYRTLEEPHFVFLQCEWLVVSEEQDNSK